MRAPRKREGSTELKKQINKRLTLNLLIQGAAAHTFTTASHLVKDDLEQLSPGLTELYDRFAISGQLNYCIGDNALMFGRPNKFWGMSWIPQKPFRKHRLMAKYGNRLAVESTRYLKKMGRSKRLSTWRFFHWCQFIGLMSKVTMIEKGKQKQLEEIAVKAISEMWQIPIEKLDGKITANVAFGNLQTPRTMLGRFCRTGVIGYGGVERREGKFSVVARAWVFPILIHELVKGTVELICLHGLNHLDEETYQAVVDEADQLEYEAWLLQAGPEMWRKFIAAAPRTTPLSRTIMQVAKLEPDALDDLMVTVIDEPNRATDTMKRLIPS